MIGNIILLPKIWWLLRFLQVIHKSQQRMFVVELHTQILTAGEYGISLSQSLVFVAPISPRSTTSPGAVFLQGAIWEHNPHRIDVCFLIHYFLWSAR